MSNLSEELQIFLEVGKLVSIERSSRKMKRHEVSAVCGSSTENIIRAHLLSKGLNISRPRVYVTSSWMEIDMLSLRNGVDPSKTEYSPYEVKTVIEVKNNVVADQTTVIKGNFNRLREISDALSFAVIVLSERDGYKYAIREDALGYPVFTLISRKVSAGTWMCRN